MKACHVCVCAAWWEDFIVSHTSKNQLADQHKDTWEDKWLSDKYNDNVWRSRYMHAVCTLYAVVHLFDRWLKVTGWTTLLLVKRCKWRICSSSFPRSHLTSNSASLAVLWKVDESLVLLGGFQLLMCVSLRGARCCSKDAVRSRAIKIKQSKTWLKHGTHHDLTYPGVSAPTVVVLISLKSLHSYMHADDSGNLWLKSVYLTEKLILSLMLLQTFKTGGRRKIKPKKLHVSVKPLWVIP